MGIAGAGFGAARSLEAIMAEQMIKAKLEQQQAEDAKRFQMEEARLNESIRQNDLDEKFRTRQEDRIGAQDRERSNAIGVRRMIGEGIQRREPLENMQGMAFAEGIDLPQAPKVERDPIADHAAKAKIDAQYRTPTRPERDPIADHEAKLKLDQKYKQKPEGSSNGPSPYAAERAKRTVDAVDRIMGKVGLLTAGPGSMLSMIPGTDSRDFEAELNTLKSNIAFNELAAMREASKTGGALGAVSDREMTLLQSVLGGLDSGQSPSALRTQLQQVKDSVQRWQAAEGLQNPNGPITAKMPDADAAAQALIDKARAARGKPQ